MFNWLMIFVPITVAILPLAGWNSPSCGLTFKVDDPKADARVLPFMADSRIQAPPRS